MDKIDSRTLPVDALNERRRRAVKMRLDGTSLKETAAQCEMSRTTVIAAVKAFEAGGWKAVDVDRGGRPVGSGRTLTSEQEREVQRLIRDRTPDQFPDGHLKFPHLWPPKFPRGLRKQRGARSGPVTGSRAGGRRATRRSEPLTL